MVRWMLVALAAAAGFVGEARAEDMRRLTIELDWRHVPRKTDGSDPPVSSQAATVPGATVRYLRFRDGGRTFGIDYDSGMRCTVTAEKGATAAMTCGTPAAYFSLLQFPGQQTRLEWVFDNDQNKPAAERESAPAPKVKVKL